MPKYRITKLVEASNLPHALSRELYTEDGEPVEGIIEIWAEEETE